MRKNVWRFIDGWHNLLACLYLSCVLPDLFCCLEMKSHPLLNKSKADAFLVGIKQLHRWLFRIPENPCGGLSVGRVIMAVSAMCMTLVLLTGVVIWWPKSKKALKNRLTVSTNKSFRRFVYDTHVSLGIYAFVFLFLMVFVGLVFSFKSKRYTWANGVDGFRKFFMCLRHSLAAFFLSAVIICGGRESLERKEKQKDRG